MNRNSLTGVGLALLLGACGGGGTTDTAEPGPGTGTGIGETFTPGDTGDSRSILGSWATIQPNGSYTFFSFFSDGDYVHIRQGTSEFDEQGLELGTYSRRGSDGLISTQTEFDENEGTGLSGDASGSGTLTLNRSGDELVVVFMDNQGSGELSLPVISADGIFGTWRSIDTSTRLNMLSFHADGTYLHAQVDTVTPSVTSGAEKGTYTRDDTTGEINITSIVLDDNGEAGLSGYSNSVKLFVNADGNTLTLGVDTDGNGESDEDLNFLRE